MAYYDAEPDVPQEVGAAVEGPCYEWRVRHINSYFCPTPAFIRFVLRRYQGNRLVSADNWEELEEEATEALEALGGAINWSGQYPCPLELAKRGKWDEPPAA